MMRWSRTAFVLSALALMNILHMTSNLRSYVKRRVAEKEACVHADGGEIERVQACARVCAGVCAYARARMRVCVCACARVRMRVCVCACVCLCGVQRACAAGMRMCRAHFTLVSSAVSLTMSLNSVIVISTASSAVVEPPTDLE